MKIITKSEDEKIECFYDSVKSKNTFTISVPNGLFCGVIIRINVAWLDGLISALADLRQRIKIATGR